MSIIKWWWLDTTKFGVICYIAVDYQNGKVERPDKNSKLPLERKLSFEVFFFFFWSTGESIWYVQTLFCQAHLVC